MSASALVRLTWRLVLFGWSVQTAYYGFIHTKHEMYQWPALLTIWGFILHLLISTLLLFNQFISSKLQLVHLYNSAFVSAFTITVMYWLALYPNETEEERRQQKSNIEVHGGTLATLLIDFLFNDVYVTRFKQNLFAFGLFLFGFLPVSMGYALYDKPVYNILTYKDRESYIYVGASLVLELIGFGLFLTLSKLKWCINSRRQVDDKKND